MSNEKLKPCPFCNFGVEEYCVPYEDYKPKLFKDKITNTFAIECQNCGVIFLLYTKNEEEAINFWNNRRAP